VLTVAVTDERRGQKKVLIEEKGKVKPTAHEETEIAL